MTQKAVPNINKPSEVGNINLSRVKSIVFTFDGYNNRLVNYLADKTLNGISDNNELISLRLTRNEDTYTFNCVIKDHLITVQEDTGNETHSLTLTTRGM